MSSKPDPATVFFLGAGASVKAGVPDTYKLVDEFRSETSSDSVLGPIIAKIIDLLTAWKRRQGHFEDAIDVELLLEALERLKARTQDFLLEFYNDPKYLLEDQPEKGRIVDKLRDFIKRRAIVERDKISYLQPLLSFVKTNSP